MSLDICSTRFHFGATISRQWKLLEWLRTYLFPFKALLQNHTPNFFIYILPLAAYTLFFYFSWSNDHGAKKKWKKLQIYIYIKNPNLSSARASSEILKEDKKKKIIIIHFSATFLSLVSFSVYFTEIVYGFRKQTRYERCDSINLWEWDNTPEMQTEAFWIENEVTDKMKSLWKEWMWMF